MDVEVVAQDKEETKMPKGKKLKAAKQPSKLERNERLKGKIINLATDLMNGGFGALLKPPGAVKLIANPVEDPKTGGIVGHVEEPLGTYIQRVSVVDNFSQRPPFDHAADPIYRRLIRDFIDGAAMPETKVAAMSQSDKGGKVESVEESDIRYSMVDGLQRLWCWCIAVLLVWRRDSLVKDGCIPADAWDSFKETVERTGDSREATEKLLKRVVRYEIFYKIDLAGLLHYMVTFNTGQRRMSLPVQLEIMRSPLIEELEKRAKIPVWHEIQSTPGLQRPKEKFLAADLVLATEAFISNNSQVTAGSEAEEFLNQDQAYLENVGDIADVVKALKRICTELHPEIMRVYAADVKARHILTGMIFLVGLSAACGYVRNRCNMKQLDGALDRLMDEIRKPIEDPLKFTQYHDVMNQVTSSRGKAMRRLVDDTFRRFFTGSTTEVEWLDTARVAGIVS